MQKLWNRAYGDVFKSGIDLSYWYNLPKPSEITDEYFFSELAWCIYNAGMKEQVIRNKWPALTEVFKDFVPDEVNLLSDSILIDVLKIFNHKGKANAVIKSSQKIINDRPIGNKLGLMLESEALVYFETYPFVGKVTKYHVARNCGFDVVKPDRHLVKMAQFLNYESPDELAQEISCFTGEKKGFIDYILWQWMAWGGKLENLL